MAKKPKSNTGKDELSLALSPRWIGLGVALALLGLVLLGLWRIELMNRRVQAERGLKQNPQTADWVGRMNDEVHAFLLQESGQEKAAATRGALAEAIWLGTVAERPRNRPDRSHPEVVMVRLKPAWRLAGKRSPKDEGDREVSIGVRDFNFASGPPQLGERWLFAVQRRNGGYNFVRDAMRVP